MPGAEANSSIAVINIDGSDFTQLTSNEDSSEPEWSPDGNQIVFQRSGNIYIINVDGTNIRALTRDGESYSPTWSPDGKKIAFVSAVNRRCGLRVLDGPRFCTGELRVINLDNQNIAIIRNKKNENVLHPAWAPRN
jgi:Tol biopolymer transport system component